MGETLVVRQGQRSALASLANQTSRAHPPSPLSLGMLENRDLSSEVNLIAAVGIRGHFLCPL